MRTKIAIMLSALMFLTANSAFANPLEQERQEVIAKYIDSLGNADIQGMEAIFSPDSIVVSTSAGKKPAIPFFSGFFPLIENIHTRLHQRFEGLTDKNRYAARFHLDYTLYDGSMGNGEYMDEFVFDDHSARLRAVYMFENLKF